MLSNTLLLVYDEHMSPEDKFILQSTLRTPQFRRMLNLSLARLNEDLQGLNYTDAVRLQNSYIAITERKEAIQEMVALLQKLDEAQINLENSQ